MQDAERAGTLPLGHEADEVAVEVVVADRACEVGWDGVDDDVRDAAHKSLEDEGRLKVGVEEGYGVRGDVGRLGVSLMCIAKEGAVVSTATRG
jgi:hypothetical protein